MLLLCIYLPILRAFPSLALRKVSGQKLIVIKIANQDHSCFKSYNWMKLQKCLDKPNYNLTLTLHSGFSSTFPWGVFTWADVCYCFMRILKVFSTFLSSDVTYMIPHTLLESLQMQVTFLETSLQAWMLRLYTLLPANYCQGSCHCFQRAM